jgi:hypothetical protein
MFSPDYFSKDFLALTVIALVGHKFAHTPHWVHEASSAS